MKAAVYCGTRNVYSDMVAAAKSLAKNSSGDIIYFLIEDSEFPWLLPSYIQCINVSSQKYFGPKCPNVYKLWTYMTLMRAILPKLFLDLDRVLSLDNDTVIDQNIDELWDIPLDDYYLAGVSEPKKSKSGVPYVNMGAVMFNLKLLRSSKMTDRIIKALNNKKYEFAEQDCINELCAPKIKALSSIYNSNEFTELCKDPKIIHYANSKGKFRTEEKFMHYSNLSWDEIERPKPRYIIHSAPARQYYVDNFLVPSMLEQGIERDSIIVRCDNAHRGNLLSCMDTFKYCGENPVGGSWHLQDDVIISRDFAEKTKQYNQGVVCGAVVQEWGPDWTKTGSRPADDLWYSFQCVRIPDELAGECAKWFFEDVINRTDNKYRSRIIANKHDDDFFRFFILEKHPHMRIYNLAPNLVDHIDYLLGGSIVNSQREKKVNRMAYWTDEALIKDLEEKLRKR